MTQRGGQGPEVQAGSTALLSFVSDSLNPPPFLFFFFFFFSYFKLLFSAFQQIVLLYGFK